MEYRTVPLYLPKGVDKVIGFGSSSFIGRVNDDTVLKYPRIAGEQWDTFVIEQRIYKALGSHPRILAFYGLDERGLKLEYATRGTVRNLLRDPNHARSLACRDRIKLCRQAAEAIAYIHTKNVIHCDISTRNFLLDKNLDVKLSDFQGIYVDQNGVVFNGHALENVKSYLPRPSTHSNEKSDLFALGSTLYEIMVGYEPFPELDELDDEEEIEKRYADGRFPALDGVMGGHIIHKCWSLAYNQVNECVEELKALEDRPIS
ncbi:kinase-like protein [Trematosphaeria pertusa]|uniref:EKC/KEOPS complex subunit BUD32 n=1 Tax=Trematosphaeria pertusa TaxID=390896 RepID=A0A6A6IVD4_9PLEO|nr:kinase-like protein [Trematosphaeria pertusa]KAF2254208.1 kinase-like protein [Trematosphaeria pertusa]